MFFELRKEKYLKNDLMNELVSDKETLERNSIVILKTTSPIEVEKALKEQDGHLFLRIESSYNDDWTLFSIIENKAYYLDGEKEKILIEIMQDFECGFFPVYLSTFYGQYFFHLINQIRQKQAIKQAIEETLLGFTDEQNEKIINMELRFLSNKLSDLRKKDKLQIKQTYNITTNSSYNLDNKQLIFFYEIKFLGLIKGEFNYDFVIKKLNAKVVNYGRNQ